MPIAAHLQSCPEVKLYTVHVPAFPEFDASILEPGLSVVIFVRDDLVIDYLGGTLEGYDNIATAVWVDILAIQGQQVWGKAREDSRVFNAGSRICFERRHVCRINGSQRWNMEHLTVLCSKKVLYQGEQVGYFYNAELLQPWSFGRIFYARSEIHMPKESIPVVEVPLAVLVSCDPVLGNYLDDPALKGMIRVDDRTFRECDLEPRDVRVFPVDFPAWYGHDLDEDCC